MASMPKKKPAETAGEFLARLEADPEWVAGRERRRAASAAFAAQHRDAQKPLLNDLSDVGFDVATVEEVTMLPTPYPAAIPVLLEHLRRPYPSLVLQAIARALAVPEARIAWPILEAIFIGLPSNASDGGVKFAVGNALAESADESVMDHLAALLRDTRHGEARLALLRPFLKRRTAADRDLLSELSSDPDLRREIRARMGRPKRS
jgi:hypothetical protein